MELGQLLNAIVEVSQAVARMPCEAKDKNEVLDKIKNLFSCYTAMSNLVNSLETSKNEVDPKEEETPLKQGYATAAASNSEHKQMQEKIQNMDEKLHILEQKLNSNEERMQGNAAIEETVSGLSTEFSAHKTILSQIRHAQDSICNRVSRIENKSNELEVLQNRIDEVSALVQNRSRDTEKVASFEDELLKIHREIAGLEGLIPNDNQGTTKSVAFLASTLIDHRLYKGDEVIQFRGVHYNLGECYDMNFSRFRTKSYGLYFFSTSINTNTEGYFTAAIMHNDLEVALFGTPGNKDLQTSTSVVLLLDPDESVYIKVTMQSNQTTGVQIGGGFSNFLGYKIA